MENNSKFAGATFILALIALMISAWVLVQNYQSNSIATTGLNVDEQAHELNQDVIRPRLMFRLSSGKYNPTDTQETLQATVWNIGISPAVDLRFYTEGEESSIYGGDIFKNNGGGLNQIIRYVKPGDPVGPWIDKLKLIDEIENSDDRAAHLVFQYADPAFNYSIITKCTEIYLSDALEKEWYDNKKSASEDKLLKARVVVPVISNHLHNNKSFQHRPCTVGSHSKSSVSNEG